MKQTSKQTAVPTSLHNSDNLSPTPCLISQRKQVYMYKEQKKNPPEKIKEDT
jgi:hypothetical protein